MKKSKALVVKTSEVKDHAKFSASGSERWLNCPASIKLSEKYPPLPESEYAKEGTEAHACFEFFLKNSKNLKAAVAVARKKYPQEMVDYTYESAKQVVDLHRELGGELLCERKVDSSPFTCGGQFGTLDAAIVNEFGRLVVIDYKYGAGHVVDPAGHGKGNSQLVYYALALSYQYDHMFSEVELMVIQPRAFHESGETTRSFVLSIDELADWRKVFQIGVDRALSPNAPARSGPWCKWCPAKIDCPELKEEAFHEAQIAFDESSYEDPVDLPEPSRISLKNLPNILNGLEKIDMWAEGVRAHAFHLLNNGHPIKGWKLVEKRSQRKWKDEAKAEKDGKWIFGEEVYNTKLKSPAQLEKLFDNKKEGKDWISKRTTQESSGYTMVKSSDKREEITPLSKVFED